MTRSAIILLVASLAWLGCEGSSAPQHSAQPPVRASIRSVFNIESSPGTRDSLAPPYPNPYNHQLGDTSIRIFFSLADSANVKVIIQNPIGDSVAIFKDDKLNAGAYEGWWTPLNSLREPLRAGLYFVTLRVDPEKRNYIDSRLLYIENND